MLIFFATLLAQIDPFEGGKPGASAGFGRAPSYEDKVNTLPNPLGIYDLNDLFGKLLEGLTVIGAIIVSFMVLWGAFKIITSAGNSGKVQEGGRVILWACVGFGILLLANGAVAIIQSLLQ